MCKRQKPTRLLEVAPPPDMGLHEVEPDPTERLNAALEGRY